MSAPRKRSKHNSLALALEPRMMFDAAAVTTAAQVVAATDTAPGVTAKGVEATVTIHDNTTTETVDLFSDVSVSRDKAGQPLDNLVVTVNTSGSNQALVIDGTQITLQATSDSVTTANNNYTYNVTVSGNTTTITLSIASSAQSEPADVGKLIDSIAYRSLDNTVPNSTVNVTLASLSDDGGDTAQLNIRSTLTISSDINVAPTLGNDGGLDSRENISLGDIGSGTDVAYSSNGKYAYVSGSNGIDVFSVDASGQLTAIQHFTDSHLGNVSQMVLSADGKSAYTLVSGASNIVQLQVGSDGKLSYAATVETRNGNANGGLAISADGTQVYVGTEYNDVVIYNRSSSTGELSYLGRAVSDGNSRAGVITSRGDYVYIMYVGSPHNLTVYQRGSDGLLSLVDSLSTSASGYSATDYTLTTSADGQYLYASNPTAGTLTVFRFNNGQLSQVASLSQSGIRDIALSPDGTQLYASNSNGTVSLYRVAADGSLSLGSTLSGTGAGDIAVSGDGTSVLVAGSSLNRYSSIQSLGQDQALAFAHGLNVADNNYDALANYKGASLTIDASVSGGSFALAEGNGLTRSGNNLLLDGTLIGTFTTSGNSLTISFTGDTSKAVVNQVLHQLTYANASAAAGSLLTLTVRARDSALSSAAQVLTLRINSTPQVDSSVANGYSLGAATTETGYSVTLPANLFKDADGDLLSWTVSGLPSGLSYDPATRTISGTTRETGSFNLVIRATDASGAKAELALTLEVAQIANRAPVANADATKTLSAVVVNGSYSTVLDSKLFSDPDSVYSDSTLTWSVSGLPAGLTFNANSHTLSGTPTVLGDYSIVVKATDEHGASAEQTLTLRVISQAESSNSAPSVHADSDKLVYASDGTLSGYSYYVNSVQVSKDGTRVVIAGSTGTSTVGGVSSQGSNVLGVYSRNTTTGELTLLQTFVQGTSDDGNASNGIEVDGLSAVTSIAYSADGKYLYVAGYGASGDASHYTVVTFQVASDGTLARVGSVANLEQKIVEISASSDGKQLFVLSTNTLYNYSVGRDGSLTLKQSLVPTYSDGFNSLTRDMTVTSDGTVYAMSNGRMAIFTYDTGSGQLTYRGTLQNSGGLVYRQYDSNGTLTSLTAGSSTAFSTAYSLTASDNGYIYITTYSNFTVVVLKYDAASNTVTQVQTVVTVNPNIYPTSAAMSADGKLLYVGNGFTSSLMIYNVAADGTLSLSQTVDTGITRIYRIQVTADGQVLVGNNVNGGSTGLGQLSPSDLINLKYTEGNPLNPGASLTLADVEYDALAGGAGNYKGATLSLAREAGANADDLFGFAAGSGLRVDGNSLLLNDVKIADFSSANGKLSIVFTADVSTATANAVLHQITYDNASNDPQSAIRLTLTVADQFVSGVSHFTLALAVTGVNDAPIVTTTPVASANYDAGKSAVSLFSASSVSTVESGQTISGLTLTIGGLLDGANETLRVNGSTISLVAGSGTTVDGYNYTVTLNGSTATLVISGAGMSGQAAAALIDGLAYANSASASVGERTITLSAVKDSGGTDNGGQDTASLALQAKVNVQVGQSPELGASTGTLTYADLVNGDLTGIRSVTTNGDQVFVISTNSESVSTLSVYLRGSDGSLSLQETFSSSDRASLVAATGVGVSADGKTVYVLADGGVTLFSRDSSSHALTALGSLDAAQVGPSALIRDVLVQDGNVYLTSGDSLQVFSQANGTFSLLHSYSDEGSSGVQLDAANKLLLSADGHYLYVATSGGGSLVSVFQVGSGGALTYLMAAQGSGEYYASSLSFSADGKTLYAVTTDGNGYALQSLSIASDGRLTALGNLALSAAASSVVASPDGALLFVIGEKQIALYDRAADGSLTLRSTLDSFTNTSLNAITGASLSSDGKQLYLSGTFGWADGLLVLDLARQSSTFIEKGTQVTLLPGGTLSDPQLDALNNGQGNYQGASIVVQRQGGANSDDTFGFSDGAGLTLSGGQILLNNVVVGTFASSNGSLTLTFTSAISHADAQLVLQHITYGNSSSDPTRNGDVAHFDVQLNDGDGHSDNLVVDVQLEGRNDPAIVQTGALSPTYNAEGERVKLFENTRIDTVEQGQAIAQVIVILEPANRGDVLGVENGRILLDKDTSGTQTTATGLTYMVTTEGGKTTVTLFLQSSAERAQQVIDSLTYGNSGSATSGTRTITLQVRESVDNNQPQPLNDVSTFSQQAVVTLAGALSSNTAPVLGGGSDVSYTEQAGAVPIAPTATIHDTQMDAFNGGAGNYDGAVLTLTLGSGTSSADSLGFRSGNGLTLSGGNLMKDGVVIGQLSTANGVLTVTFSDAAGTRPSSADVQNTLRQITYANSSDVPVASLAVSITLADQRGLASAALALTIRITAVNDAPVISVDPRLSLGDLQAVQSLASIAGLGQLSSSVVSSDGTSVYLADSQGAIALFSRDASSGQLTYVRTFSAVSGLEGIQQLQVAGDGTSVYALSSNGNALAWFSRDSSGNLTLKATLVDDYAVTSGNLFDMKGMTLSADGKNLYVINGYNLVTFTRDTQTGALTYSSALEGSMSSPPYLWTPTAVTMQGDLMYVVTSAYQSATLLVYQRAADGSLTALGNIHSGATDAKGQTVILDSLQHVSVSSDGRTVYVASASQIDAFSLDTATGAFTHLGTLASGLAINDISLSANGNALFVSLEDGSLNYYGTAGNQLTLVGSQAGLNDVHQVLRVGEGVLVVGSHLDVLNAPSIPAPSLLIGGDPVLLAPTLHLGDPELDAANNYQGAKLTLSGQNGDQFGFKESDGYTLAGNVISLNGNAVATLEQTGTAAVLRFTAAVSSEQANAILHHLTYASSREQAGTHTVVLQINDGEIDGNAYGVQVSLFSGNHAPVDTGALYTPAPAVSGQPYSSAIPAGLFSDADGDSLTWSVSGLPAGLSFDPDSRTLSGTIGNAGRYVLVISVSDAKGETASRSITLEVAQGNVDVPVPGDNASNSSNSVAPVILANPTPHFSAPAPHPTAPGSWAPVAHELDSHPASPVELRLSGLAGLGETSGLDDHFGLDQPHYSRTTLDDNAGLARISALLQVEGAANTLHFQLPAHLLNRYSEGYSLRLSNGLPLPQWVRHDSRTGGIELDRTAMIKAQRLHLQVVGKGLGDKPLRVPVELQVEPQATPDRQAAEPASRTDRSTDRRHGEPARHNLSQHLQGASQDSLLSRAQALIATLLGSTPEQAEAKPRDRA